MVYQVRILVLLEVAIRSSQESLQITTRLTTCCQKVKLIFWTLFLFLKNQINVYKFLLSMSVYCACHTKLVPWEKFSAIETLARAVDELYNLRIRTVTFGYNLKSAKTCLKNGLLCIEWDVNLYSLTHNL